MNSRISVKERNLIKGAIRRVFSRSDLRKKVVDLTIMRGYTNPDRPRVKKWSMCSMCDELTPTYKIQVDHIEPIVPLDSSLADMSWDTVIDRVWCEENNLQAVCETCHNFKSKEENFIRRKNKKEKMKNGTPKKCKVD